MKKYLAVFGLIFGLAIASHAGAPQDQGAQLNGPFFHTALFSSTSTVASSFGPSVLITPPTAAGFAGFQNCFTKFVVQMDTASYFTVYDGSFTGTTAILQIAGNGIGTTGINTFTYPEERLGPLCVTAGNTTLVAISTFNASNSGAGLSTYGTTIDYEGYTTAGPGSNKN